jgi:hypothetical protein
VNYPYAAEWWGGSVRRLYSPSDAEIFDAHVSKSNKSRGFIQLWGTLAHVSLVAGELTKLCKGRRPSLGSTKKTSGANNLKLKCDLDFRSLKSVYCVRIANFSLKYALDRAHYLVLEGAGLMSLR